jgi:hypothetical protein
MGRKICEIHLRQMPCLDCKAERILRSKHSHGWYIGDATAAEWDQAYNLAALSNEGGEDE